MKFYCINNPDNPHNPESYALLKAAVEAKGLEFIVLDPDAVNMLELPKLSRTDILYRQAIGGQQKLVERILLASDPTTIYEDTTPALRKGGPWAALILFDRAGVQMPKSVYLFATKDKEKLRQYCEHVGGFPVIVKAIDRSHGEGVIRFDSFESLHSAMPMFLNEPEEYILKQYVPHTEHARLVVVGDKVVDSIAYRKPADDFRTNNVHVPDVYAKKFSPEIEEAALKATHAQGYAFGGADILLAEDGTFYLAEATNTRANFDNFPAVFGFHKFNVAVSAAQV